GLVPAAGGFAVGALRLLHIGALAGVHEAVGGHAAAGGIGPAAAAGRFLRPSFERDFNFFRFLAALDRELDFVADLLRGIFVGPLLEAGHFFGVHGSHDVVGLEAGASGGTVLGDRGQLGAIGVILALNGHVRDIGPA